VSELFIDDEDQRRTRAMPLSPAVLAISAFSIGEIFYGALNKNWGDEKFKKMENHLQSFQVLAVDAEVGRVFGRLFLVCQRAGRKKGDWNGAIDLWIAATAIRYDIPLATLDTGFDDVPGLRVIRRDGTEATNAQSKAK
jgi:predicted nucleic acid-binding protein